MVKEEKIDGKVYHQCEICKFYYEDKKLAQKCQAWCNKNNSCNVEITKHAIDPNEKKEHTCDIDCKDEKEGCSCC